MAEEVAKDKDRVAEGVAEDIDSVMEGVAKDIVEAKARQSELL